MTSPIFKTQGLEPKNFIICLFQTFNGICKHLIRICTYIVSPKLRMHLKSVHFSTIWCLIPPFSHTPSHVAISWPYLPSSQHLPLSMQRSDPESVISFLLSHSSSAQRLHSAYLCFTGRPLSYMSNLMEDQQSAVQFSRLSWQYKSLQNTYE